MSQQDEGTHSLAVCGLVKLLYFDVLLVLHNSRANAPYNFDQAGLEQVKRGRNSGE